MWMLAWITTGHMCVRVLVCLVHTRSCILSVVSPLLLFLLPQPIDHKNIRRRVYDALNVLMAMNIISKEKKEIRWIGLPTNSVQECQHIEVRRVCVFVCVRVCVCVCVCVCQCDTQRSKPVSGQRRAFVARESLCVRT